jgi:ribosomal protein S12 methylthiotransferase RimO
MTSVGATDSPAVHVVTLGCARNEVDSEELAARLVAGGYRLVGEPVEADAVLVNTCGFVDAAKKDSIDTLLSAADLKGPAGAQAVIAVGCLAERYGTELADALPEADAVLGFDAYADIASRVRRVLGGERPTAHVPRDRRQLLPLAPVERQRGLATIAIPGHRSASPSPSRTKGTGGGGSLAAETTAPWRSHRRRLTNAPSAPLKIASGCDRRCTFCAIPRFRGSYVSRPPNEILTEARWLADSGVRELFLVSENSSSYGKDLGDIRLLESLLAELATVDGLNWIRVSYLQPAEMRPSLIDVMTGTPGVVPYFDLSFQHASEPVLRRMRRFGNADRFLTLLDAIRQQAPEAGIRSNVICGFPGETDADVEVVEQFLAAARLDAIGVFGYSDEDGTEAAGLDGQLSSREISERRDHLSDVVDSLVVERAESRIGEPIEVLVEETGGEVIGRARHQGPDSDGTVRMIDGDTARSGGLRIQSLRAGDLVAARVIAAEGADLVARLLAET